MKIIIKAILVTAILTGCNQKKKESINDYERPNIIFLMDDQHRHDAFGFTNPQVVTPALDKLAKEGIWFNQAVCQAPMCVASRNSMMLGLYPNQVGILRNEPGLPDSLLPAKTLPQLFKEAGYETAGFGKTHWGTSRQTFTPSKRGFETRFIGECREKDAIMMADVDPDKKARYTEEVKNYGGGEERPEGYIGKTSNIEEGEHRDGWVFEKCMEYIDQRDDSRPLFLYLSFLKPHAAHNVPKGYEDFYLADSIKYAQQPDWDKDNSPHALNINRRKMYINFWEDATEQQWKEMTMRYYANCTWIDSMFGRVLEALKDKNILENSIIVYVSDHGEMLGERFYRFNKYCFYESSVRVPIIISGSALPDNLKGKVDTRNAELVDIYPTLLKSAEIAIPEYTQGINLLDVDQNRKASFCALHEEKGEASFMWRDNSYKLILTLNRKKDPCLYKYDDIISGELYNLEADPREWNNLFYDAEYASLNSKMTDLLFKKLAKLKQLPPLDANNNNTSMQ